MRVGVGVGDGVGEGVKVGVIVAVEALVGGTVVVAGAQEENKNINANTKEIFFM